MGRGITVPIALRLTLESAALDYTDGDIKEFVNTLDARTRLKLRTFLDRVLRYV